MEVFGKPGCHRTGPCSSQFNPDRDRHLHTGRGAQGRLCISVPAGCVLGGHSQGQRTFLQDVAEVRV